MIRAKSLGSSVFESEWLYLLAGMFIKEGNMSLPRQLRD
jgi:hypothetical protein